MNGAAFTSYQALFRVEDVGAQTPPVSCVLRGGGSVVHHLRKAT